MINTCLINSFNYARFLGEAVNSALRQTVPFDEIIVVDDGSTDDSLELLARDFGRNRQVRVIAKGNQGQLSCFNEGFAQSKGDIVFFLDADDVYEPNYLERSLEVYCRDPYIDFVFCGHRQFGERDSLKLNFAEDRDLGYSVILTALQRAWIGAPTSCVSMRRGVLEKILPLPFLDAWRIRADDCLVFGASIAGARKYFLAQPLVRYRVHGQNHFFGRSMDKRSVYRRRLAMNVLFEHLERKLSYNVERLAEIHHREFCTIVKPTFSQLMKYCSIAFRMRASYLRKLACVAEMTGHFIRAAARPASRGMHGAASTVAPDSPSMIRVFVPDSSREAQKDRQESYRHAA
jgi:glycosyltransferase involved in cell wall biosynthesis